MTCSTKRFIPSCFERVISGQYIDPSVHPKDRLTCPWSIFLAATGCSREKIYIDEQACFRLAIGHRREFAPNWCVWFSYQYLTTKRCVLGTSPSIRAVTMANEPEFDHLLKLLLVGDSGTVKSLACTIFKYIFKAHYFGIPICVSACMLCHHFEPWTGWVGVHRRNESLPGGAGECVRSAFCCRSTGFLIPYLPD